MTLMMWERNLRLGSALIVACFVCLHLVNHSLGLVSLDAMESMRTGLARLTHSWPWLILFYAALATHLLLAFVAFARRKSWNMPWWQKTQYLLGLCVPLLLLPHIIGARLTPALLPSVEGGYEWVLATLGNVEGLMFRQTCLLLLVWGHLTMGLHYWLRIRAGYRRWLLLWQTLALLLPILALLGFYRATADIGVVDLAIRWQQVSSGFDPQVAMIASTRQWLEGLFWLSLAIVVSIHVVRLYLQTKGTSIQIEHPLRGTLRAAPGMTLLELLRQQRVPHSAVCGGRGRCTTCRVRVTNGGENLAPRSAQEHRVLESIGADESVRLACQLRVTDSMAIEPLLQPGSGLHRMDRPGGVAGFEKPVVVLFADLRDSTALGEQRLPYDVVFILNQFFAELAQALEQTGGHYAQFNGDGLMALYGVEGDYGDACRDGLRGALAMQAGLDNLNKKLAAELSQPLRMGIGLHCGDAIVGTMGPPASPILSAVGDTVNSAARLEQASKSMAKALVISVRLLQQASIPFEESMVEHIPVRGRQEELAVVGISAEETMWLDLQQQLAEKP
ncbi:adenylate/guanylate cyclase domain-containing protein [Aestuariirhabdus sp. Z084]|uniref:adenylate/guanylate cyclase domain-containing protein n=1 Tax=Aestuariirhabdus haliotis TaxID=2918751 RepID=UPI00201B4538|nr:adenylate/guanylate cyclase domain-containing protein [Aestuariirhabdus haliotis]MCL6414396.1 adenylate/guanylate cyclase domain-containing protein [Aestuariirhabdus haliotis]MCL6418328.1 adenylate/guanylate cyclase domain-containing protein [Aestuariirhabdus haliotis]